MPADSSIFAWEIQWKEEPEATDPGVTKSQTQLSDETTATTKPGYRCYLELASRDETSSKKVAGECSGVGRH